ncbi:50S ribosomal protein L24 [Thermoclostridium stercorarium subsp. stercorarium DSM 8532]|jgi:large subunit ribosomal protein L24|uniref:Large ribosomal subunit protein uL24 n=1 Tax=Thermoclostridium stercorarium (strain ATCC 35414 / DSM 8532 / NCIMB 11754) TaxID=1121335 RepID=L7VSJ3_THES1|nr:50S ribosomal protein L24 [Thermoclostridium stercorarium subsp. stercorarium DSM 8532]
MGKQEQVKVQKPERGEARELKNKVHVKKGDTVYILNGKDRGKKGKVLRVLPSKQMVIVEGVNMVAKHVKPRSELQQGGIIHREAPIYAAKVMLVCSKCGAPTKVGKKILEDGSKARVCKKCGEIIDILKKSGD